MTYTQAKVFECMRTGMGATTDEIMRVCSVKDAFDVIQALADMIEQGFCQWRNTGEKRYFFPTSDGIAAYERWMEAPF